MAFKDFINIYKRRMATAKRKKEKDKKNQDKASSCGSEH